MNGRFTAIIRYCGDVSLLFGRTVRFAVSRPLKGRQIINQMYKIGVASLPIVTLTALFTGVVLAFHGAYLAKVAAKMYIARLVSLSMVRELGPVLIALVVAGRVSSSIAAELGTMKVTEQIDALETLAANPIRYLVVPRLLAAVVMLPLLTTYGDIVGMFGGYLVGTAKLGVSSHMYIKMSWEALAFRDIFNGLTKSFFFGVIISIIGCHEGFATTGGAEGVGRATTTSVVVSFILIVATNCLFAALFYFAF